MPSTRAPAEAPSLPGEAAGRVRVLRDCLLAAAISAVTLWVQHQLPGAIGTRPLAILYMLPILLSAMLGGLAPGLVATAICALGLNYYFIPPLDSLRIAEAADGLRWGLLIVTGVIASALSEALRRSRRREIDKWRELAAAERLLRDNEAQFKATVEQAESERTLFAEAFRQASQPLLVATPDFFIRYVNPAYSRLLGYPAEALIGRYVNDILPDTDAARASQAAALKVLEASGSFTGETDRRASDGSSIPVALSVAPIRDAQGSLMGWVASYLDLRPLRKQEALQRTFALAAEQSTSHVIVTDLDDHVQFVNEAAAHANGRTRAELLRMPARQLLRSLMPDAAWTEMETAIDERRLWRGEVTARRDDGQAYPLALAMRPLIDSTGSVASIVVVGEDISERVNVQAELDRHRHHLEELVAERTQALDAANARLTEEQRFTRTVADAVPGLVGYVDKDERYRFTNAAYRFWFGVPSEALIGRTLREVLGKEVFALNEPHIRGAFRGERQQFQRPLKRHDGALRDTLITYIPHRDESGVRGFFTMATDVTDLKSAERQLAMLNVELAARVEQAESATRAKSAFLANMSHEIRTPMNAIIGLTHLMARDARDAAQRERLAKVDTAAKHLLQVINDVLDLSKIEAGKLTLEEQEFSLDEVLSRSFELVSQQAREKGLELILDTDHLPQRLRGDSTRLSQSLVNLLSNAVKFTERGWVSLRGDLLREERERIEVRFEVQDTGEGIDDSAQAQLFRAFEQADGSTTRRHGGTGLGLALTRHLVHLMGGEIGVTSAPGSGSTFWFNAWLKRGSEAGERAEPLQVRGLRALVVDDLPEALAIVCTRLRSLGVEVDAEPGGTEALARVRAAMVAGTPYDLFLIDWRMAPLDGIETLHRLREMLPGAIAPAILFSAFDEPTMWEQARGARYDAVLVKPITDSALHDTLMRVLRRQPPIAPTLPVAPGKSQALLQRRHAGQRILLAEDNRINQEVAETLLTSVGLVVELADNGERAVELATSRSYDLVLMDVHMPEMDGLDATRAIRTRAGRGLPIIAMTANAFAEDRAACLAAGMNDHVAKPVDPEHLYATLLRWLPLRDLPERAGAGASAATASLPERLASVEGFDAAHAMRVVNGQATALERVLQSFVDTYRGGVPVLLASAAAGDGTALRLACHSLRGACSTIGALALTRQIVALESANQATTAAPVLAAQAQVLHEALLALVARLDAAIG